jgi:hypothetical protein
VSDMLKVEMVPDLENCIETVARKKHAELSQALLKNEESDPGTERKVEILGHFLETADFKQLRAESEKMLIEGKNVRFLVYFDNGLKCDIQVN